MREIERCPYCGEMRRECCDSVIGLEHQAGCDGTPGNVAKRREMVSIDPRTVQNVPEWLKRVSNR